MDTDIKWYGCIERNRGLKIKAVQESEDTDVTLKVKVQRKLLV